MPGSLKIKIMSARNLPVMDRASDLTDAFVEIRFGNDNYKTDVYKKSLNPFWNTDWFTFELDDQQLQEESLQIRVLDHDTYSSHDSIGKVYINLETLLIRKSKRLMTGWFPIYDTMHGIQGELNLSLKLDLFSDVSKYRQSSIGVKFFFSTCIPQGYYLTKLVGFVEELIIVDDPEHEWREKLRTSRSTNESRQRLFSKLTGELQRKMGVKVLEEGGNCVIGFQVYFDLEGESGVVIRGIGSAVYLGERETMTPSENNVGSTATSPIQPHPPTSIGSTNATGSGINKKHDFSASMNSGKSDTKEAFDLNRSKSVIPSIVKQKNVDLGELPLLTLSQVPVGFIQILGSIVSVKSVKLIEKTQLEEQECRDAWWLELRREMACHMRSLGCTALLGYTENCVITEDVCVLSGLGSAVCLNKQFQAGSNTSGRRFNRNHAFDQQVTGDECKEAPEEEYSEEEEKVDKNKNLSNGHESTVNIIDGSTSNGVTNVSKKAWKAEFVKSSSVSLKLNSMTNKFSAINVTDDTLLKGCQMCHLMSNSPSFRTTAASRTNTNNSSTLNNSYNGRFPGGYSSVSASPLHDPSNTNQSDNNNTDHNRSSITCKACGKAQVPEVIFSTLEVPAELEVRGQSAFIQARVCRTKRETKGENCAKEINELLPFLEYDVHYKLLHNLFLKGLNALFGLKMRISIGHNLIVAVATGTGVFLSALPAPILPKSSSFNLEEERIVAEMTKFQSNCCRILNLRKAQTPPPHCSEQIYDGVLPKQTQSTKRTYNRSISENTATSLTSSSPTTVSPPILTSKKQSSDSGTLGCVESTVMDKMFVDTGQLDFNYVSSVLREGLLPNNIEMCTTSSVNAINPSSVQRSAFSHNYPLHSTPTDISRMLIRFVRSAPLISNTSYSSVSVSAEDISNNTDFHLSTASNGAAISSSSIQMQQQMFGGVTGGGTTSLLTDKLDCLIQQFHSSLWFKLRRYLPLSITGVDYRISVTEDNNLEILFSGLLVSNCTKSVNTHSSQIIESNQHKSSVISNTTSGGSTTYTRQNQACFLFCPLSNMSGFNIENYLGSLNFFFVRETTYMREFKGASGFMQACIGEVQSVVAAQTVAAGGNALFSCAITELMLHCGSTGHTGQILINIRGDMVYGNYVDDKASDDAQ